MTPPRDFPGNTKLCTSTRGYDKEHPQKGQANETLSGND